MFSQDLAHKNSLLSSFLSLPLSLPFFFNTWVGNLRLALTALPLSLSKKTASAVLVVGLTSFSVCTLYRFSLTTPPETGAIHFPFDRWGDRGRAVRTCAVVPEPGLSPASCAESVCLTTVLCCLLRRQSGPGSMQSPGEGTQLLVESTCASLCTHPGELSGV